jgi:hypothetical protein
MNFIELVDYDIMGVAKDANGVIVDGVYLIAKIRRRTSEGDGPVTEVWIKLDTLTSRQRTDLFAAFQTHESMVLGLATTAYEAAAASPEALDEKIAAALRADAVVETKRAEEAELDARLAAKRAELAAAEAAAVVNEGVVP